MREVMDYSWLFFLLKFNFFILFYFWNWILLEKWARLLAYAPCLLSILGSSCLCYFKGPKNKEDMRSEPERANSRYLWGGNSRFLWSLSAFLCPQDMADKEESRVTAS